MQSLYSIHLILTVIFVFMGMVYLREFQVVIASIEITGVDSKTYDAPSFNFGIRALFFCIYTIYVGYKTRRRMLLTGQALIANGAVFAAIAIIMIIMPRYLNIYDTFRYWGIYCFGNIVLTIIAAWKYESSLPKEIYYEDNILDDKL